MELGPLGLGEICHSTSAKSTLLEGVEVIVCDDDQDEAAKASDRSADRNRGAKLLRIDYDSGEEQEEEEEEYGEYEEEEYEERGEEEEGRGGGGG
ncbi:hypothetical protein CLOM_g14007 [Closterium sp. NIES-68]|nr:hypothetical protein CLOM_g14007 [Closterium sp. NIES-68]